MGRKRIPEGHLKKRISIRLKQSEIDSIKEHGSLQEIIEQLVHDWVEQLKHQEKSNIVEEK